MSEAIYPRWRYHKEHTAVLVQNAAEDEALGEGWGASDVLGPPADAVNDTPIDFEATAEPDAPRRGRKPKAH